MAIMLVQCKRCAADIGPARAVMVIGPRLSHFIEFFSGMVEKAQRQNETMGGTLGQIADRTGKVMKKINKITDENPEVGEEGGVEQLPGGDEE